MNLADLPKAERDRIEADKAACLLQNDRKGLDDRIWWGKLRERMGKYAPEFKPQVLEAMKERDKRGSQ
jgi:hypothetical protein